MTRSQPSPPVKNLGHADTTPQPAPKAKAKAKTRAADKLPRRRPEARPDEILDTALELFLAQGFHRTTVEQIARGAKLSKGAVYLYFPAKPDILLALVRRAVGAMAKNAAARLAQHRGDPRAALRDLFQTVTQIAQQDDSFAKVPRLILHEAPSSPQIAQLYRDEVIAQVLPALIDLLERGMRAGFIRTLDADMTARCVVGPLMAHLLLAEIFDLYPEGGLDWPRLIDTQFAILDAGLAPLQESDRASKPT